MPTLERFPVSKKEGGKAALDNAILAHRLCNRLDHSLRVGRSHRRAWGALTGSHAAAASYSWISPVACTNSVAHPHDVIYSGVVLLHSTGSKPAQKGRSPPSPDRRRAPRAGACGNEMETTGCNQAKNARVRTCRKRFDLADSAAT